MERFLERISKSKYKDNFKLPAYLSKRGYYPLITNQIRNIQKLIRN